MKLWIKITLIFTMLPFLAFASTGDLSVPFTSSVHSFEGYVVNIGKRSVTKYGNMSHVYTVRPFKDEAENGKTAADYMAENKYAITIPPAQIVFFTTKNANEVHPDNQGCVFMFTADDTTYHIASAPIGTDTECSAQISDGPGFDKSNFLVVNITS